MSQRIMYRRAYAGIPITATAAAPLHEPGQRLRFVTLDWIVRSGGQTISDRSISLVSPAGR